jgi:hypothetical protein
MYGYRIDPGNSGVFVIVRAAHVPQRPLMGLSVSPDARAFLYCKTIAEGSDLMLIENFR